MKSVVVLGVCFLAVASAFDTKSLIPELDDELGGSLTQVLVGLSHDTSLEAQEQYQQVIKARQVFQTMIDKIKEDQESDDMMTGATQAALAADVASLQITVHRHGSSQQHHQQVATRLGTSISSLRETIKRVNQTIVHAEESLAHTQSECQSIKDRQASRAETLRGEIKTIQLLQSMAKDITCEQLQMLVQTLEPALRVKIESKGCDCTNFIQTSSPGSTPCDCNSTPSSGALHVKEVQYSCESRKQQIHHLLEDLQNELYSSTSQDAYTFDESHKVCMEDVKVQQEAIHQLSSRMHRVLADLDEMADQQTAMNKALASVTASLQGSQDALTAAQKKQDSTACRHNKRTHMRAEQTQVLRTLLDTLNRLDNSAYVENHIVLTSGCLNNCSNHGLCFQTECHCDDGYAGSDCSLSQSKVCPFLPDAPPCTSQECYGTEFPRLREGSECARIVCDTCRDNVTQPGCLDPSVSLFCAQQDRRNACDVTCQAPREDELACGVRRVIRQPFIGCCFNPILDCQDKCSSVQCAMVEPQCGVGLMVKYPLHDCCFNPETDCVDQCSVTTCPESDPVCPGGKSVRHPFVGCCFDASMDCEDDCTGVTCDEDILPGDVCRAKGLRWSGSTMGCCFNEHDDCIGGDDTNQSSERTALTQFYHSTNGQFWIRQSAWNTDQWICLWDGIECSGETGNMHVTAIKLPANHLTGTIPPEIEQLVHLREFDVSENEIEGPIPSHITPLKNVHTLRLRQNKMTGDIPQELSELPQLEIIDLSQNLFTGNLPNLTASIVSCAETCMCDVRCGSRLHPGSVLFAGVACEPCVA